MATSTSLKDEEKSKEQLLEELIELRASNTKLLKAKESREKLESQIDELMDSIINKLRVYDSLVDGIIVAEAENFNLVMVNKSACNLLGYTEEELLKMNLYDIYPQDSNLVNKFRDKTNNGIKLLQGLPVLRKNRETIYCDVSTINILYDNKPALLSVFKNDTERVKSAEKLLYSEKLLKEAQRIAHIGNWDYDVATGQITWSDEIYNIFGLSPKNFKPTYGAFLNLIHPDDRDIVIEAIGKALYENKPYNVDHRIVLFDGTEKLVNEQGLVFCDSEGTPIRMTGVVQDITERAKTEYQMRLASKILENSVEGIAVTDANGNILLVNPAFTTITGYTSEEVIGKNPRILKSGRHDKEFYDNMWKALKTTGHWKGEIWNRRKNGEVYPELLSITSIKDAFGKTTNYVSLFHDITEIKKSEERLKYQAFHDPLTDLPNRLLFNERLNTAIKQSQSKKDKFALIFLDLDNFKNINDSLGHHIGDILLISVAERLIECTDGRYTVSRYGGDEFTFIIDGFKDEKDIIKVINRIFSAITKPFLIDRHEFYITGSIGISIYPTDGESYVELIKNADSAMYEAKKRGKNQYQFYTSELNSKYLKRLEIEKKLRKAIESQEFFVVYQPKVDLTKNQITSMEALIRWKSNSNEFIPPSEFIPIAEETGLIVPIGEWVLKTACSQTKFINDNFNDVLKVNINLSGVQFKKAKLVETVQNILDETDLDPNHLCLEITESILMDDVETAIDTMHSLRNSGIKLSIDDFGMGYSSLSYLKRFPINELKIDKSFIQNINIIPEDEIITKTVITMGHNLNLRVVAEGVEKPEQFEKLKQYSCDEIQGYLFSPPIPKEKLLDFIKNWKY